MMTVGSVGLFARFVTVGRELCVASRFGTGDALDAYLVAFALPFFAISVVAGSFNAALIPTFIAVRERDGRAAAQRLLENVTAFSLALLTTVSVALAAASTTILHHLASGFAPDKLEMCQRLFFIFLPLLVLTGMSTTWTAILNAGERFAAAAAAPIVTPLVPIGYLLLAGTPNVYAFAAATVTGYALEATLIAVAVRQHGYTLLPKWRGLDPDTMTVIREYWPAIVGALLMSSTILINQGIAGSLPARSVSALSYGNKIVSFVAGIGALSLGTAVMTQFSRMAATHDFAGIRHTLRVYGWLTLGVTVPLTATLIALSEDIVRIAFLRGAFTSSDAQLVSQVQSLYLLQLPPYILGTLLVRLVSSLKGNRILLWAAGLNLAVNIALGYAFTRWLGVAGLALATSGVYLTSAVFLAVMCRRLLARTETEFDAHHT